MAPDLTPLQTEMAMLQADIVSETCRIIRENPRPDADKSCQRCDGTGWEYIAGYHPGPHPCPSCAGRHKDGP